MQETRYTHLKKSTTTRLNKLDIMPLKASTSTMQRARVEQNFSGKLYKKRFLTTLMLLAGVLLYCVAMAREVRSEDSVADSVRDIAVNNTVDNTLDNRVDSVANKVTNSALNNTTQDLFAQAAPQGFGDRQNSWAWSMQWWNDYLYVGVNRSWHCAETGGLNQNFPLFFPYPPDDPDVVCPENLKDLMLAAEIWRWSPDTDIWERVFQSPNDIQIPNSVGKVVARDIGFRGMNVFTEADGTEALYVASVSPRFMYAEMPPPRILRSTDGLNFESIPQDPGTAMADYEFTSLRNQINFKGRLYVIAGSVQGSGVLLESRNPADGNDEFRVVSPPGKIVSTVGVLDDHLYIGLQNIVSGYSVVKTDASGEPPYRYTQVVSHGGYAEGRPNHELVTMKTFDGRLYAGGNGIRTSLVVGLGGPAELIRINPDDSWDVVVGDPRDTPDGWKYPLSGFESGFSNFYNGHIWRMEVYEDSLYIGTFDSSTLRKEFPNDELLLGESMGFDLYRTSNGSDIVALTTNGFDDRFNFGVRSLEATPHGLFLGTANYYYGLQIWQLSEQSSPYLFMPIINQ